MFPSFKKNTRKKYSQTSEIKYPSISMKQRFAKVKKLQNSMKSLCDNDSSSLEDVRPFFLKSSSCDNSVDKSSDEDNLNESKYGKKPTFYTITTDESENDCQKTDKTLSKINKHKNNVKDKKINYDNIKKKNSKNEKINNDSEDDIYEKHINKKEKKHLTLKSKQEHFINFHREDSSSGKEFQKSKISCTGLNITKKLTQAKKDNVISIESDLESIIESEKKFEISKEQSLQLKFHVVKIFNKFKEACSEYELQMERVKCKYFKKELIYQKSVSNVIQKTKNVINNLKIELDAQEKELINFYEEWNKKCKVQNLDHEDNLLNKIEVTKKIEDKEESDTSKSSSNVESIVSECDNEEIFSDTETNIMKINIDKNRENEDTIVAKFSEKSTNDSENSNRIISPILGNNKKGTRIYADNDLKIIDENKKKFKEFNISSNEHIINESVDDIFKESIIENTDDVNLKNEHENEKNLEWKENEKNNDNKNENFLKNDELNVEVKSKNLRAIETKNIKSKSISSEKISESVEKEESISDEVDDEEQAKRAMLESDSETPTNEESLVEKFIKQSSTSDSFKEKDLLQTKKIKFDKKKGKNKISNNANCKNNSSDEDEIIKEEACAKNTLLESNSDDSTSPYDIKKKSNKKYDSNDDSEKLNSIYDNDIVLKQTKNKNKDSIKDDSKQQIFKINYIGSDRKLKMLSEVIIERLPENILKKHKNALQKSRQYLESKEFKSLIDLDRLQKDYKNNNDITRSSLPRNMIKHKTKEKEDSLLDHLKNVKDDEFIENTNKKSNMENNNSIAKTYGSFQTNKELIMEADAATKKILLYSSDSDIGEQKITFENSENEIKSESSSKKSNQKTEKKNGDKENDEEWKKNKWRRNKLLTMKFSSDSDSDITRAKWNKKQEELSEKVEETHVENLAIKNKIMKRERRNRRKIIDSDSDIQLLNSDTNIKSSVTSEDNKSSDSDTSVGKPKKMRKRKTYKSSDTDSSFTEKRSKPKRKRIKNMSSDTDSDNDQIINSQGTPGKKGRKNIRKVMKDKQVTDDTKQAAKEEEERLKRIAERQKLYNEMYEVRLAGEEKVDKLILDFNPETKEELITVHKDLVKRLKPHQAKGIKFMWDACFESLERINCSPGSGCIIAHCMGLGKSLQVIALAHTLLTHEKSGVKTIMIVCPLSTVLNWLNEFKYWLNDIENDIEIYEMTKLKKNIERKFQLESWQRTGGILLIGYEMFRNLTGTNNRMRKNMKEAILRYLIDPGPDMIVCDEGHLLKNEDTALSKSIKRIRTLRRIVLTGTPLQNNLIEYHCMVQFVKPNLLGTKREFLNRFANPITNGQFDDSTEYDVKIMKKRAYVLHKMLKGCVQRFDYSVLTPFLPPKQEYVIFVSLTEVQINMYKYYLDNFARRIRNANGSLFADFQALQRIWTHPIVLQLNAEKIEKMNEKRLDSSDSEGSLRDFINDRETDSTSTSTSTTDEDDEVKSIDYNVAGKNTRRNSKNNKSEIEIVPKSEEFEKKEEEWWSQFVQPEHFEDMRISSKLILLFGILKECEQIGDKVLVFSQSLYSLTLIEQFLEKIDNATQNGINSDYIDGHTGSWSLGLDYFRLDGQTSAENRNIWCKIFNEPSNTRARLFLISTRAGGLGINLTAANRVIIFDASWNPSHDVQSIFRIYRFGQKKPCYVYRFLAAGTMEEKIYNRQVTKLSLSCRVVDEQQIERHYSNHDLSELYSFEPNINNGKKPTLNLPKDRLLAEIFLIYKNFVENYHEHDSLLENKAEEELNEEERKQAWLEYEEEKKGKPMPSYSAIPTILNQYNAILNQYNVPSTFNINTDYEKLRELLQKDYPNATPETQQMMTNRVLADMYTYWERQAYQNSANRIINQNPNINPIQVRTQVPNLSQMSYAMQNTNQNLTNQPNDYRTSDIRSDDDVVEVTSSTVNNKNKNQEE